MKHLLALTVIITVIAATFSPATAQAQAGLTAVPVSCWDLDEAGGIRVDAVGTNDLADNGLVGNGIAKTGAASAQFTGVNALSHIDNADLSITGDFTIAFWFNAAANKSTLVGKIIKDNNLDEYQIEYDDKKGRLRFRVWDAVSNKFTASTANNSIVPGNWYFVTAWYDQAANSINLQIDNGITVTAAATGYRDGGLAFVIGANSDLVTRNYAGLVDAVAIWKSTLLATDIAWLWNGGLGRICTEITAGQGGGGGTGPGGGTNYAVEVITLPSGSQAAIEMRVTAGDMMVSGGLVFMSMLSVFQMIQRAALSLRASSK